MAFTLNLAVLPVAAGLLAGTGAIAAMTPSSDALMQRPAVESAALPTVTPSPTPPVARSCDAQTWPYVDASCGNRAADTRKVRIVSAPRADETPAASHMPRAIPHIANPQPPAVQSPPPGMVSSDGVLRSRDIVVPPKKASKRERRAEQRRAARSYAVPAEGRASRAMIVVRPLRVEAYR